jgi:phage N-6-adenine-methyltransferase
VRRKTPSTRTENPNQRWQTPDYLFDVLHGIFHFSIDACATPENAKLPERYWTLKDNALNQDWGPERAFCNPPFSGAGNFLGKAAQANLAVVVWPLNSFTSPLVHSSPPRLILIPDHRIEFGPPAGLIKKGNTRGTCLLIYGQLSQRELAGIREMANGLQVPGKRKTKPRRFMLMGAL